MIGGVIGAIAGAVSAAVSSVKSTGELDPGAILLGAATGAIGGVVGASGLSAGYQALASGLSSVANNIGAALIQGNEIEPMDVLLDFGIGVASSLIGSRMTQKAADSAKSTILKGIRKVLTAKENYDSGSRYWKGAAKRGLALISKGVYLKNVAQGESSVIGSAIGCAASIAKTMWP